MKILYVGQSTFKITLDSGTTLLTDPWFNRSRFWRAVPAAYSTDQIGKIDFILPSHNHLDHFDSQGVKLAQNQNATVIGPLKVARRAEKNGIKANALKPGDKFDPGPFSVTATPAFHPMAKDAIGFLISADSKVIYFSGDTRMHPDLVKFLKEAGKIDLAFLQIACARYFGKDDGLNLITAEKLAREIRFGTVIPMHYHGRWKEADPNAMRKPLETAGIKLLVIELGGEIDF